MKLTNLTKDELMEKVRILVSAIKADESSKFSLVANWDETSMTIQITPEPQLKKG